MLLKPAITCKGRCRLRHSAARKNAISRTGVCNSKLHMKRLIAKSVAVLALPVLTSQVFHAQEFNFCNFGVTESLNSLAVRQVCQGSIPPSNSSHR